MATGTAFVATTPDGPTAIVLLGRGRLAVLAARPVGADPDRIFSGGEQPGRRVRRRARPHPAVGLRRRASPRARSRRGPPSAARCPPGRRTTSTTTSAGRSNVDLNDLSRDRWSLLPQQGDLIAEIRTKRFGNLTYARSQSDAEDMSFFDRRRKKNIAVYASTEKLATAAASTAKTTPSTTTSRRYDLEADFSPERLWIDGRAKMSPDDR